MKKYTAWLIADQRLQGEQSVKVETIQNETEKRLSKNKQSISNMWDNSGHIFSAPLGKYKGT